jgi:hypothetical protein
MHIMTYKYIITDNYKQLQTYLSVIKCNYKQLQIITSNDI